MAVSGSVDYYQSITRSTIIEDALRDIGGLPIGQSVPGYLSTQAIRRLNQLVKRLQNQPTPVYIHKLATNNFDTVASTDEYSVSTNVATDCKRIKYAWLLINGTRYPLEFLDTTNMDSVKSPNAENQPMYWSYVPSGTHYPSGSIKLSPVPDKVYDVHVRYEGILNDFDSSTDNPDLPIGAVDMLTKGLSLALAPSQRVSSDERQILQAEFKDLLADFLAGQNESNPEDIREPRGVLIV